MNPAGRRPTDVRNPYAPPRRIDPDAGGPAQDEAEALTPRWGLRAAWGTVAASGLVCTFAGFQMLIAVTFAEAWLRAVPFGGAAAAVAASLAIGPCTRADAARARLFEGVDGPPY